MYAFKTLKPQKRVLPAALNKGTPLECSENHDLRNLGISCFPALENAILGRLGDVEMQGFGNALLVEHECAGPTLS